MQKLPEQNMHILYTQICLYKMYSLLRVEDSPKPLSVVSKSFDILCMYK